MFQELWQEKELQHELEKDDLLSQILSLQKEVSQLSNSSLAREKETLSKDLDKTKLKLKDTESKLKNTIQAKIKLEVVVIVRLIFVINFLFSGTLLTHVLLKTSFRVSEHRLNGR